MNENEYVSKLNGYTIKDSEARTDITSINGDITSINGDITSINGKIGNLTNLNTSEKTNLVGAINETITKLSNNYGLGYTTGNQTVTGEAWSNPIIPLTNFETNNNLIFEKNGNGIKVKEAGLYLIIVSKETNIGNSEQDCYIFGGDTIHFASYQDSGTFILTKNLSANSTIEIGINTSSTSFTLVNATLLVFKV